MISRRRQLNFNPNKFKLNSYQKFKNKTETY